MSNPVITCKKAHMSSFQKIRILEGDPRLSSNYFLEVVVLEPVALDLKEILFPFKVFS